MEEETNLNEAHKLSSFNGTMHYSFDFAKQVHFPSNHMQPGPIYFKTPCKCGIFGLMCELYPVEETQTFIYMLTFVRDKIRTLTFYGI